MCHEFILRDAAKRPLLRMTPVSFGIACEPAARADEVVLESDIAVNAVVPLCNIRNGLVVIPGMNAIAFTRRCPPASAGLEGWLHVWPSFETALRASSG
jgi:hypothetical protein